jgi:hypothetical protein
MDKIELTPKEENKIKEVFGKYTLENWRSITNENKKELLNALKIIDKPTIYRIKHPRKKHIKKKYIPKINNYEKKDWIIYLRNNFENISTLYKLSDKEKEEWNQKIKKKFNNGIHGIFIKLGEKDSFNHKNKDQWRNACSSIVYEFF